MVYVLVYRKEKLDAIAPGQTKSANAEAIAIISSIEEEDGDTTQAR